MCTALWPPQPPGPVPPSSGIPSLLRRELHRYGLAPSSPALRRRAPSSSTNPVQAMPPLSRNLQVGIERHSPASTRQNAGFIGKRQIRRLLGSDLDWGGGREVRRWRRWSVSAGAGRAAGGDPGTRRKYFSRKRRRLVHARFGSVFVG